MILAIAQIDVRLGDLEELGSRIEAQAVSASARGARLLCVPLPIVSGPAPAPYVASPNFTHDVLGTLTKLAARLDELDMTALIPAYIAHEGEPIFEIFKLAEGRVCPLRLIGMFGRMHALDDGVISMPLFDVDGVRCTVSVDATEDTGPVPPGCDLLISFQSEPLDVARAETAGAAGAVAGPIRASVGRLSAWFAQVVPIGSYAHALYAGGSYVMDDAGRLVAAAPSFEEDLLVCEVERGVAHAALEDHEIQRFERFEWLWDALAMGLVDHARAEGRDGAAIVLEGSLPSSLAAALAVDAFGPRKVAGLLIARSQMTTPEDEARERARVERVRALAGALRIRLVERWEPDLADLVDADAPAACGMASAADRARLHLERFYLDDLAASDGMLPVSALTKTDYALAPEGAGAAVPGEIAPFGDVYLTALEYLARTRSRRGSALPAQLVSLQEVERCFGDIVQRVACSEPAHAAYAESLREAIGSLGPIACDAILEAALERAASFEDLPVSTAQHDAAVLVLMRLHRGEAARRALPELLPVTSRPLTARLWPQDLAWSDTGRDEGESYEIEDIVRAAIARTEVMSEEASERVRGEVMGLVAGFMGLGPEELEHMAASSEEELSPEATARRDEHMQRLLRRFMERAASGGEGEAPGLPGRPGMPFFSQN